MPSELAGSLLVNYPHFLGTIGPCKAKVTAFKAEELATSRIPPGGIPTWSPTRKRGTTVDGISAGVPKRVVGGHNRGAVQGRVQETAGRGPVDERAVRLGLSI